MRKHKNQKSIKLETIKDKSTLVKLLAEEDLTVTYQKVPTASFNVKTRQVILPIWKDKSEDVADMMSLHEVGHALYTPEDMIIKGEKKKVSHSFLNVLEDVRIEKMIQDKYLGSVKIFKKAYTELLKKDFFGIKGKDLTKLNLIDRINMHYKNVPNVPFDKNELPWVKKANETKTSNDVLKLAIALQKWMKLHQKNVESDEMFTLDINVSPDGDNIIKQDGDDSSTDSDNQESSDNSDSDSDSDSGNESVDSGNESDTSKKGKDEDEDKKEDLKQEKLGKGIFGDDAEIGIKAITDDNYQKRQYASADKNANRVEHVNIPKINLKDAIVDYKDVNKDLNEHYQNSCKGNKENIQYMEWVTKDIKKFKKDQSKTISYMVKEFEMKKAADQYKRATISKTGRLNMDKLHSYSYNEDIFLKVTTLPGATNHGLVMFVDWSGSMADNFHNTIKQTLNLVWFCQRVNIPFEVYGFTNGYSKREDTCKNIKIQKRKQNDLVVNEVTLLNILSSRARTEEFNKGMINLWALSNYWNDRSNYSGYDEHKPYPIYVPSDYQLHSTPLNHSIIVAMDLVPKFKKDNGLQKVHTVFLTDGYSNTLSHKYNWNDKEGELQSKDIDHQDSDIILSDPITNKKWTSTLKKGEDRYYDRHDIDFRYDSQTFILLSFLKARVKDMNVVNFFIAGRNRKGTLARYDIESIFGLNSWDDGDEVKRLQKEMKKKNVLVCTTQGWDEMYILPGGQKLDTNQDTNLEEILPGATKGQLKKAFGQMTSGRKNNRPVLNKFIGMIA